MITSNFTGGGNIGSDDYKGAFASLGRNASLVKNFVLWVSIFLAVLALCTSLQNPGAVLYSWLPFFLFFPLVLTAMQVCSRFLASKLCYIGPVSFEADASKIQFKTADQRIEKPWSDFSSITDTPGSFVLAGPSAWRLSYIVPKHFFADEAAASSFADFVNSKLPSYTPPSNPITQKVVGTVVGVGCVVAGWYVMAARFSGSDDWRYVQGEKPTFGFDAAAFEGLRRAHWVGYGGDQRTEVLHISKLAEPGANLVMEVRTGPPATIRTMALHDYINRYAAPGALPKPPREYFDVRTRFDVLRATRFAVSSDGMVKECVGFQSASSKDAIYFRGLVCDEADRPRSVASLACALDTLVLRGSFREPEAQKLLTERTARSGRCGVYPVGSVPEKAQDLVDTL